MLRETRSEHARKLDLGGATLIAVALFALISPLIEGREQGWPIWSILMLSASGPLLLIFWRYELKVGAAGGDPIVEPRLLQLPGLKRGLLSALFFYAFAAFWLTFSVYQQGGLGRTPFEAGVAILPAALGFVLGPFASGSILRVFGRYSAAAGMTLEAAGLFGTAALISFGAPEFLFVALFLIGAGQGIALPNLVKTVVQRVDPTRAGLASGLVNSMLQIGGALATALIGGLFFSILGSASDEKSIGHAYSIAAVAIGLCLLVAGWLSAGLPSKKEVHR
jgi:MFS family permease